MNVKEIKEMLQLMNENNLIELEIEKDGLKVRLKRSTVNSTEDQSTQGPIFIDRQQTARSTPQAKEPPVPSKTIQIKSPMIGTFYRAPSPDSPAFIEAGDTVAVGQIVCIVEAMKLMNEIKSEVKGKVVEVLVENGQPVEFGQPLFTLEPA
jgi:acetyl-CoA carboxylase biotin carboxyl carrier protein